VTYFVGGSEEVGGHFVQTRSFAGVYKPQHLEHDISIDVGDLNTVLAHNTRIHDTAS